MADKKEFNQINYQNEWLKKNYKSISLSLPIDLANEFKEACKKLGVSQRSVLVKAVEETIKEVKNKG
ncbi:MAG: hypothetical protein Q4E28_05055 [Clostridia bacterium]|nr:hypothetical protein [Clostridia bacterium]